MVSSEDDHAVGSILGRCWTPHGERQGMYVVRAHSCVNMVSMFSLLMATTRSNHEASALMMTSSGHNPKALSLNTVFM